MIINMKPYSWFIFAVAGLAIRIYFIEIIHKGENYKDGIFSIFTDLDYKVYLDATQYQSPYERHTYRYSPILSYLVTPSYPDHQLFGKYLIIFLDVIAAFFFYKIFADREGDSSLNRKTGVIISMFTYLNPFLIYICIRGSCQGITMILAASFWYFYFGSKSHGNITPQERIEKGLIERQPSNIKKYVSYVIFGLWVHFRVYPIIFVPMLIMHEYHSVKENKLKHAMKFALQFGLISGGVFLGLAIYFYHLYGYDFLHQTYIYHLTRRDNRYSKSVFFLQFYLNYESDSLFNPLWRTIFRNLPTLLFMYFFNFYFIKKRSVFYCQGFLLLHFVLFNKVITDQYYLWIFNAIVLVVPELKLFNLNKIGPMIEYMMKTFALCAPTMVAWAFFKVKFQESNRDWNMFYFWIINLANFIVHLYSLSFSTSEKVSLVKQENESSNQIKCD